jgi:colanic acid biosynthesis protein WcaH
LKDERISQAFERIIKDELDLEISYSEAQFFGVYEHLYPTNFAQVDGFGTHYVVLSHKLKLKAGQDIIGDDQHSRLEWFSVEQILNDEKVHQNTKAYFQ